MKSLSELAREMQETIRVESTQTSSNPDAAPAPADVHCFDPDFPDEPCPICHGLGVVKYNVPTDHPRFGKLFRCPNKPISVDEERQAKLRKLSNLSSFADKTFENFETDVSYYTEKERQTLRIAYESARKFARHLSGWLLLEGQYGTGKTHLAAAIGNERLIYGDQILFITTPDLLDHLRNTFSPQSDVGYDELFDRVRNTTLLILDDLGVENPSEWAKEKLFQLLNHRYAANKPTVITTNVDLDNLDPRIRSRLMDINVIQRVVIDTPDFRNHTPNENEQILLSRMQMYREMTFENFDVVSNLTKPEQDNLLKAARAAEAFAHTPDKWLLYMGNFGSGKTHLAAAIANYRRQLGDDVLFLTTPDLFDYLRSTFDADSNLKYDKLFAQIRDANLLVLDDLGMEYGKGWVQEKLFQIVDYRYTKRLPTVMTTAKKLEDLSPRLVSRLIDKRVCQIFAINVPGYAERMNRR